MEELIDEYTRVVECDYKGEHYSVRDNGAVLRHSSKSLRVRPLDNKWTFGRKNDGNGYMIFSGAVRVHQIVAAAFHGIPEDKYMVVDHIDTNKCNNRPENLRWVTRLENALNNPITRKRIILCCGSIEAFLDNPLILRESASEPNTKWMRTVSKEEAQKCRKNLERWAMDDKKMTPTKRTDEGVFSGGRDDIKSYETELTQSLSENAVQVNWRTPSLFPLCPTTVSDTPLKDYAANLSVGKAFCTNKYNSESKIVDFGISEDGGRKYFTLALGKEWIGGDVFDDYC